MSLSSLIPALCFAAVALLIILIFFRVVIESLVGDLRGWPNNIKLKRKERLLTQVTKEAKDPPSYSQYSVLRDAFFLDEVFADNGFLEKMNSHHNEILSWLVAVSERYSKHLDNIVLVEELLQSRSELMKLRIEIADGLKNIKKKRKEKGQTTPEWAKNEFMSKLGELNEKITTNRRTLDSQLNHLFQLLEKLPSSQEVTYH